MSTRPSRRARGVARGIKKYRWDRAKLRGGFIVAAVAWYLCWKWIPFIGGWVGAVLFALVCAGSLIEYFGE